MRLDRIGPFQVGEVLGRGGQAEVLAGRCLVTGAEVALKVSLGVPAPQAAGRLMREFQVLRELAHPSLPRASRLGRLSDGRIYLALRQVRGVPVTRAVAALGPNDAPSTVRSVERWLVELAEVLAYIHDHGLVHGDVKPGNLMVDEADRLQLLDFGGAHYLDSPEPWVPPGSYFGTPTYSSPEQLAKEGIGASTDVYAWGVVAFRLLTGRRAFQPGSRTELLTLKRSDGLDTTSLGRWASLVAAATSAQAEGRPTSKALVAQARALLPNIDFPPADEALAEFGATVRRWRRAVATGDAVLMGVAGQPGHPFATLAQQLRDDAQVAGFDLMEASAPERHQAVLEELTARSADDKPAAIVLEARNASRKFVDALSKRVMAEHGPRVWVALVGDSHRIQRFRGRARKMLVLEVEGPVDSRRAAESMAAQIVDQMTADGHDLVGAVMSVLAIANAALHAPVVAEAVGVAVGTVRRVLDHAVTRGWASQNLGWSLRTPALAAVWLERLDEAQRRTLATGLVAALNAGPLGTAAARARWMAGDIGGATRVLGQLLGDASDAAAVASTVDDLGDLFEWAPQLAPVLIGSLLSEDPHGMTVDAAVHASRSLDLTFRRRAEVAERLVRYHRGSLVEAPESPLERARTAEAAGSYTAAVAFAARASREALVAGEPADQTEAEMVLARARLAQGAVNDAILAARRASEFRPVRAEAIAVLVEALVVAGRWSEARDACVRGMRQTLGLAAHDWLRLAWAQLLAALGSPADVVDLCAARAPSGHPLLDAGWYCVDAQARLRLGEPGSTPWADAATIAAMTSERPVLAARAAAWEAAARGAGHERDEQAGLATAGQALLEAGHLPWAVEALVLSGGNLSAPPELIDWLAGPQAHPLAARVHRARGDNDAAHESTTRFLGALDEHDVQMVILQPWMVAASRAKRDHKHKERP